MERTQRLKKILIESQDNFDIDENGCIHTKTSVIIEKLKSWNNESKENSETDKKTVDKL